LLNREETAMLAARGISHIVKGVHYLVNHGTQTRFVPRAF
jgi:hypothetical protein